MKLSRIIVLALRALCFALFAAMIVIVFAQVILRYFFSSPLAWSEELARLLLVWVSFLGITLVFFSDAGHPAVTALVDRLSPGKQNLVYLIMNLAFFVLLLLLGIQGVNSTVTNHRFESPVLHYPGSVKYAVVPLSMFLMSYRAAVNAWHLAKGLRGGERGDVS